MENAGTRARPTRSGPCAPCDGGRQESLGLHGWPCGLGNRASSHASGHSAGKSFSHFLLDAPRWFWGKARRLYAWGFRSVNDEPLAAGASALRHVIAPTSRTLQQAGRHNTASRRPAETPTGKLVGNLWTLWKTQDSRLWNLWTTPPTSLPHHTPFATIGPSQEPVHNCLACLEIDRLAAHIYRLSPQMRPFPRSSGSLAPVGSGTETRGIGVSTVTATTLGCFPHRPWAFSPQTRRESRQTARWPFNRATRVSTCVESAVDKQGKAMSEAVANRKAVESPAVDTASSRSSYDVGE